MTVIAGRYRLLDVLGEGGMGTVWRARDEVLGREVAVKEVRAGAGLPAADRERLHARLEREARSAARITHRNVVTVYDVALDDDRPWIVMELVPGLTLAETLEAEGPLPPRRAAHVGAEVCAALRAAHEAGVLHRDVKPANVQLANDGRVVLTDFGIAAVEGVSPLTMTGELIGSPEYLAPERALGRTPGPAADLWSLGILLYAAVEGVSPFRRETALDTLRTVVDEEPAPPAHAGPLAPVIEGLLRKDPEQRPSAAAVEEQLRLIGAGGTPRTEPLRAGPYAPVPPRGTGGGSRAAGPMGAGAPGGPGGPVGPGATAPLPAPGAGGGSGSRPRGRWGLVAGIAALLLVAGGLTYAALRDTDADGTPTVPPTTTSAPTTAPTAAPTTSAETTSATPSEATTPPVSVLVNVRAVRDSYSGACPPPEDAAPSFTAAVTVDRTPATVSYRWVTESGEVQDAQWRTLEFAEGGPTEQLLNRTQAGYGAGSQVSDRIRVEVREPVARQSNWVEFSVTCEETVPPSAPPTTATPSGGTASPGGAPAGASGGAPGGSVTPRP
ncbi:serine/threonine-protein kinase [Streptomyces roseicoloratus]|uniref:non-specific serine/threonine protein kinase n=1 Tax=Streptomyces roseicoloratus TaxID=2508722 RepID=A0ABY9S2Z3_9ACTN|nr:serine/threonine-protein kinase [Streptomyces roseicoloratus]WMX47789.1 serine/threonine-protein kinase [Streptomyces roseicoloratus]